MFKTPVARARSSSEIVSTDNANVEHDVRPRASSLSVSHPPSRRMSREELDLIDSGTEALAETGKELSLRERHGSPQEPLSTLLSRQSLLFNEGVRRSSSRVETAVSNRAAAALPNVEESDEYQHTI